MKKLNLITLFCNTVKRVFGLHVHIYIYIYYIFYSLPMWPRVQNSKYKRIQLQRKKSSSLFFIVMSKNTHGFIHVK